MPTLFQYLLSRSDALLRGDGAAGAVHGNELAQFEAVSEDRDLKNRTLGEGRSVTREKGDQSRWIKV